MSWTLVAHTVAFLSSSGTTTAIDTTGADLIVVTTGSFAGLPTLTDSKSNTWTAIANNNNNSRYSAIYYCGAPTVGSGHTFSITSSQPNTTIEVQAWSGSAGAGSLDQSSSAAGATLTLAPSITTTANGELIIAGCAVAATGASVSIDSGFTLGDHQSTNAVNSAIASFTQTTAGAIGPTWTFGSNFANAAVIASFKAASGGGGATVHFRRTLSSLGTRTGSRQAQAA